MISIFLPDKSEKKFDFEPTGLDVAQSIGPRLAKDVVGVIIDDGTEVQDLRRPLKDQQSVRLITSKDELSLEVIRHTSAHVMAQAVQELFAGTQVTIGPVIEDGFYYDFYSDHKFVPEDLPKIEKQMQKIISQKYEITAKTISSKEAIKTFEGLGEHFKVELIKDLGQDEVTVYTQGGKWFDLCRGPHLQNLSQIKAVKLLSIAGSYWRGDENKEQLQRIYATAFNSQKDLEDYIKLQEEIAKRDHRVLGKQLKLFHFNTEYSPGLPFYTKDGYLVYRELENLLRQLGEKYDYSEISTPLLYSKELFEKSGHYDNYKENMYFTNRDETSLKPMNCPGHCLLYKAERYSYKDLPLRFSEFGKVHRYERKGVLHGMTRVRGFCQDDAHIFCTEKDLVSEIKGFMAMLGEVYKTLNMPEFKVYLSTRPEKRMGSDEIWDKAEKSLKDALEQMKLSYEVDEGEGAFYGPKLDIVIKDSCKRPWQLGTLQCDFNMPEAFDLSYVDADNTEKKPIMLHRAILGSLERFIGVYLEHTAGHLPFWLCPTQVCVVGVSSIHEEYASKVAAELKAQGVRSSLDMRNEKVGFKIREAQLLKIPYMIVLGDKEVESNTLSVRLRTGQMISNISLDDFKAQTAKLIKNRTFELEQFGS